MHCAIRGDVLLSILEASGKLIRLDMIDDGASIRIADGKNSYVDLPVLGPEHFIYKKPKEKYHTVITVTEAFIEGLATANESAAKTTLRPKLEGVTVIYDRDQETMELCATDDTALTHILLGDISIEGEGEETAQGSFILPRSTVMQFVKVYKELKDLMSVCTLSVGGDHAILHVESGEEAVDILSKLVPESPHEFADVIEKITKKQIKFKMPSMLSEVFTKCAILGGNEIKSAADITVQNNSLTLRSKGQHGEITKVWSVPEGIREHEFNIDSKVVAKYSKGMEEMCLGKGGMVFYKDNITTIVGYLEYHVDKRKKGEEE